MCFAHEAGAWEEAASNLRSSGLMAFVGCVRDAAKGSLVRAVLGSEERWMGRKHRTGPIPAPQDFSPDIIVDLAGMIGLTNVPILRFEVNGQRQLDAGLASLRSNLDQTTVVAYLDDEPVAHAFPMISQQTFLSHNRDELYAAVQALIVQVTARHAAGALRGVKCADTPRARGIFALAYTAGVVRGLCRRTITKTVLQRRPFYWQTAWRWTGRSAIADTLQLDGPPFRILPDDGQRFYADPFAFVHEDRHYLFVEEYPYEEAKGVISVAEVEANGSFGVPRRVLEEDYHLSYPNVFRCDGQVFMLPESGDAQELVLYRCEAFPDTWIRHAVLISGRSINDATLVKLNDRIWMFATERFGSGSASDTMVVYSAQKLDGPWLPHRFNPILIDRAGARPGGQVIERNGRLFLPVQDGTKTYGGGLGLRQIVQLDDTDVVLGPVLSIAEGPAWARCGIHTLNRAGLLEVVDSTG
ncbi:hypothetical protein GV67_16725 [Pseudorhizobium pelagicum]|uniref:Glucosamine inositolphosphorylceramide transferase 1 N-terminal domain-containing protein n=1 Tax=Pseudorhizobium pelagicum TaxID=1509405 RepID=A0A922T9I0_9HYPH|nr:hypothetical protein GV68_19770 [Pseudorhizobium pelagicum]KEQ02866.1 hypothetical protein GV67_16725 [Pseudorhizobium pelagicum]